MLLIFTLPVNLLFMYKIATLVFLSSRTLPPSPTLLLPFICLVNATCLRVFCGIFGSPTLPPSPTLLLPFICLVNVTCLRVFCGIFGSNVRFTFFSPSFSTSTLGTNLLLPVLIIMFIILSACSFPFPQIPLAVFTIRRMSPTESW